jgi:hypothetical protein
MSHARLSPNLPMLLALLAGAACAQDMSAPDYQVGDRWNFRETDLLTRNETGQIGETVVAVEGKDIWIDARRQARTWWRVDAAKRVHAEQLAFAEGAPGERGKTIASNDGGCAYPYPLKVGQKFECSENVLFPNGWKVRYELKWEVEAAEKVGTPAGSFDALRLKAQGFAHNETNNHRVRHERLIWLAPAAKREVKHEIRSFNRQGQPSRVEGRELVGFQPG